MTIAFKAVDQTKRRIISMKMGKKLHKWCLSSISQVQRPGFCFILFLFLFVSVSTDHISAQSFVYSGCSQTKFPADSPLDGCLRSLLSDLVSSSFTSLYSSRVLGNGTSSSPFYGLYQCRGDVNQDRCASCVRDAVGQLSLICSDHNNGARLQLDICYIRYENSDFLGKLEQEMGVVHKQCNQKPGNGEDFYRQRDAVLADLQTATSYRLSIVTKMEGLAQCLGDLSPSDCSTCLSQAAAAVKNVCGAAVAADVYLSQCYIRYWMPGYSTSPSPGSPDDAVGRTVAIVVGALAGVALVIVVLSYYGPRY